MKSTYFKIELEIDDGFNKLEDEIEETAMSEYECDGIEEYSMTEAEVDELLGERSYSGGDLPESVLDEVDFHNKSSKNSRKIFYFSQDKETGSSSERAQRFFEFLNNCKGVIHTSITEEDNQDWNEVWRKDFKTIEIDQELAIIPSWEKDESYKFPVYIYPGQGFGTGNHETTYLCLKGMKDNLAAINKSSVLDYGCGSGILGIAAKKVGFSEVDLYDIDHEALENAKVNIESNFSNDKTTFNLYLPKDKNQFKDQYDLIFANILAPVLEKIVSELKDKVSSQGILILSGILRDQEPWIKDAYEAKGFIHIKSEFKGDWCSIILKGG